MSDQPVVLVAASEPAVRRLVGGALRPRGFAVVEMSESALADEAQAEEALAETSPDLVVLDSVCLPPTPLATVRAITDDETLPIVAMSGHWSAAGIRETLDAGADDFVARPFDAAELAARVRSLLRRQGEQLVAGRRSVGRATVDLDHRLALCDGRPQSLTRSEWRLLLRLIADEGAVVAQHDLLVAGFGWQAAGDPAPLRATISRLRRKLGADAGTEGPIQTVRGFGYRLLGGAP